MKTLEQRVEELEQRVFNIPPKAQEAMSGYIINGFFVPAGCQHEWVGKYTTIAEHCWKCGAFKQE